MYFRVLGPVDVWDNERSHSVGPWKEQTILAILVLEAGRVVSAQTLAERLWDERIPDHARGTLQAYISRLRSRLREAGDETGLITSSAAGGYRLAIDSDQADVRRFHQMISDARAASAAKDLGSARALLVQAEGLWRGEPLDGLTSLWAETTRQALLERRRGAILARIGLDLQLDADRSDAISELAQLASTGRIDQSAIEMLMRALASAGREDEALATYRSAQARLREQLGVYPRAELTALHQQILRGEPLPSSPATEPAQRGALAPNTLDRDPPYLIGRDEHVHDMLVSVTEDLESTSGIALYALDGMPGIGKTAVALRAAHQLAAQCPDGALQINFRTHDPRQPPLDPRTALVLLLEALGAGSDELGRAGSLDELAGLWRRRTRGLRLLLLLDDVPDANQINTLVPVAPGSVTLVTSRRRLPHLPGARHCTLGALNDIAAIRLLTRITGRRFPDQARDLHRFASHCGGLPLAVVVASAHLRAHPAWSLADLVNRLETWTPATGQDQLSAPVHRAFELSYRTLPEPHRRLLRLLAIQPVPDIGVHAVAALIDDDPAATDLILETLVENHLLDEVRRHRYRLHDLLRDFATRQASAHDENNEIDAAIGRVISFYIAAAAHAERIVRPNRRIAARIPAQSPLRSSAEFDQPAAAHAWLDAESTNLLAVAAATDTQPPREHAGVMACIMAPYLDRRGLWPQAVEVLTRAMRAVTTPSSPDRIDPNLAQLHVHLAAAHVRLRNLDDATAHANTALEAWQHQNDRRGQADTLLELGRIHWYAQRPDQAIAAYESSETLYRHLGHPSGRVLADYHRAIILFEQGRHTDALHVAHHALTMVSHLADTALECDVLLNLAEMYLRAGQDQPARECLHRAEHLAEQHRDPQILAALALNTGILHHRAGNDDTATPSLHTALELFRTLGDRGNQIDTLTALSATHRTQRALDDAHACLHEAELLLTDLNDPQRRSRIETETGLLLRAQDELPAACTHLRTAVELARQAHAPLEEAHARRALADTLTALNDPEAEDQSRQALALYQHLGHPDAASIDTLLSDGSER